MTNNKMQQQLANIKKPELVFLNKMMVVTRIYAFFSFVCSYVLEQANQQTMKVNIQKKTKKKQPQQQLLKSKKILEPKKEEEKKRKKLPHCTDKCH